MLRADITPEEAKELRDQITMLSQRADISEEDLAGLMSQIATLSQRADISEEDLAGLRSQIATLSQRADISEEDLAGLMNQIERLANREDEFGRKWITAGPSVQLPPGLSSSTENPLLANDADDTFESMLSDSQSKFAPLTSTLLRDYSKLEAVLSDIVYISSISGDGDGGYNVEAWVDGDVINLHFGSEDKDPDFEESYSIQIDGDSAEFFLWTGSDSKMYHDTYMLRVSPANSPLTAEVTHAFGVRTPNANLPDGTATYNGGMQSWQYPKDDPSPEQRTVYRGAVELNANFATASIDGKIDSLRRRARDESGYLPYENLNETNRFDITNGRIINGQFAADLTGVDSNAGAAPAETVRGYDGRLLGEFYGAQGEEVGGVLNASSEVHNRVLSGVFSGVDRSNFEINTRIPAGMNTPVHSLLYWEEGAGSSLHENAQVTNLSGDNDGMINVTYTLDGTEHTVEFSKSHYLVEDVFYRVDGENRYDFIWSIHNDWTTNNPKFEHFNVAGWATDDTGSPRRVLRGFLVYGMRTNADSLPSNSASYEGELSIDLYRMDDLTLDDSIKNRIRRVRSQDLSLDANFADSTIAGQVDNLGDYSGHFTVSGQIDGSSTSPHFAADMTGTEDLSAFDLEMKGDFFGPTAENVGGALAGTYSETGSSDSTHVVYGWFGGKQ